MRNIFAKSLICLLCVAASASAEKKPLHFLIPENEPQPSGHLFRLHRDLLIAAESNDIPKVKNLLAMGADINVIEDPGKTFTPLIYAASNGYVEMTRFLLAHGADPNAGGVIASPLYRAIDFGDARCVQLLLQYGADPEHLCYDGERAIETAADYGKVGMVKLLIWRMPRLDRYDARKYLHHAWNIALNQAVSKRPMREVQAAVAAGANLNNLEGGGEEGGTGSPLMRATARGSLPIM